jgi:hypothetical protein
MDYGWREHCALSEVYTPYMSTITRTTNIRKIFPAHAASPGHSGNNFDFIEGEDQFVCFGVAEKGE